MRGHFPPGVRGSSKSAQRSSQQSILYRGDPRLSHFGPPTEYRRQGEALQGRAASRLTSAGNSYTYSWRKTQLGSTCDARRAGMYAPTAAMARSASVTSATSRQLNPRALTMTATGLLIAALSSSPI